MKQRWTGCTAAAVILVSLCLPAFGAAAASGEPGEKREAQIKEKSASKALAAYTVEHIGRDEGTEKVLERETFRPR